MTKILTCFGTIPEYIKVKSLLDNFSNVKTCFTGQHKDLLKNIKVDYELSIDYNISENILNNTMINIFKNSNIFNEIDYVLIQGDTTTACAIALSAFNNEKKIIHLEAGLRSGDLKDPYPEEMNRQVISRLTDIHLCPTQFNKENLEKENINGKIYVVGNTCLDNILKDGCEYGNKVLIAMHGRDNFKKMDKWFEEIEKMANKYPEIEFIIPLNPNPNVNKHKVIFNKVKVIDQLQHSEIIEYLKKCKFIISESGYLQEECSYLNKKIIVCRKTTERPESAGVHSFMCEEPEKLEELIDNIVINYEVYAECPYGDGKSWEKINIILKDNYWNNFYKLNKNFNYKPSTFFYFVTEYLKDYSEHKTLIELGCSNGTDLIHFSKTGLICTAIDYSRETCNILKKKYDDINIICNSFIDYDYKDYDIYYSRLTLHTISYENVLKFIENISEKMSEKSLLFIETRSIMGEEYENYDYYEENFKSEIGDYYYRTLFKKDYLINLFNKKDIFVEYELEEKDTSLYKEDPYILRLVLRKVHLEKYLDNMITMELFSKQVSLKKYFDEIVNIFEENNINYVVFFGNLIGLLRHNNLFIPWDDDIDILINEKDIEKINNIFSDKGYLLNFSHTELVYLEKNKLSIDLFYKHYSNTVVDLNNYYYINNYRIPKEFNKAFENNYKNFSHEKIMEECIIFNHKINDRWTSKHMVKVKKNINCINKILNLHKLKKEHIIENLINELKKTNIDEKKIDNICIYIVIYNNNFVNNLVNNLLEFLKSMIKFNFIDSYIFIPENLYIILSLYFSENFINILKDKNIYLFEIKDEITPFDKEIFKLYLDLDEKNKKKYDKIIIYQDFPIFINNYNSNNIYFDESFNLTTENKWHNEEINKDKKIFEKFGIQYIYGNSSNGIIFDFSFFKKLFYKLNELSVNFTGIYPYLEVILPTVIKNFYGEENILNLNCNIWDTNTKINMNYLTYVNKF